jgi:hypothetical protein
MNQASTDSVATASSVTMPSDPTGASTDSASGFQNLLTNTLKAVAQSAYSMALNQTPSSLLNLQA